MLAMYSSETTLRVRFSETDQMGIAYYGNYAQYYEVGRVEALRQLGTSYKSMEDNGISMPVLSLKCKYIRPAPYDEQLRIITMVRELPTSRMKFEYEIYNEADELINTGETELAFFSNASKRPVRAPEWLVELIRERFQERPA